MKNPRFFKFAIIVFLVYSGFHIHAQEVSLKMVPADSKMSIEGTSSLHNWTSEVKKIDGSVVIPSSMANKMPKRGDQVKKVNFVAQVKSIESGRGSAMDNRTYDALKASDHPEIKFEMTESEVTRIVDLKAGTFEMMTKGNLNIGGKTNPIEMVVMGQKLENGSFKFNGSKQLKMTSFDIKPPTAMFGQIVTGDEVTISFDLTFSK